MRKGLSPAEADAASADLTGPALDEAAAVLPPAQIAALKLADVLSEAPPAAVGPELMTELSAHFTPGQILELGSALGVASGWQRFIEAFGIRPDHWNESTPIPPRPSSTPDPPAAGDGAAVTEGP